MIESRPAFISGDRTPLRTRLPIDRGATEPVTLGQSVRNLREALLAHENQGLLTPRASLSVGGRERLETFVRKVLSPQPLTDAVHAVLEGE